MHSETHSSQDAQVQHADSVILFLVDGMRPDGLRASSTPVMDRLVKSGASTFAARSVMPAVTLPCITSLFHGAAPGAHGVTSNSWKPAPCMPPNLFSAVRSKQRKTASFFNWDPLRDVAPIGSVDTAVYLDNSHDRGGTGDRRIAELAAEAIRRERFAFMFVYLGHVDIVGHDAGFMSQAYLDAISAADASIGVVLESLTGNTATIVLSDHGGHGKSHGVDCAEDMTIPIIVNGPCIAEGRTILDDTGLLDVAPTVLSLLGLEIPKEWAGKPIAFNETVPRQRPKA